MNKKEINEQFEVHRQIMYGLIKSVRGDFKHELQIIKDKLNLTGTAGENYHCDIKGCSKFSYIMYMGIKYCEKHMPPLDKSIVDGLREYGTAGNKVRRKTWHEVAKNVARDVEEKIMAAGECTCASPGPFSRHPDCPLHGWEADIKRGQKEYQRFNPTPDLPLNAKVAKALGWKVEYSHTNKCWMRQDKNAVIQPENWYLILNYPNDLVAAMGALEEYCEKNSLIYKLIRSHGGQGYMGFGKIYVSQDIVKVSDRIEEYALKSDSLPQAICEAIVKHAEGE